MPKTFPTLEAANGYKQTFNLGYYLAVPFLGAWALKHIHGMHFYGDRAGEL